MEDNFEALKLEVEGLICPFHNKHPRILITDYHTIRVSFCCEEFALHTESRVTQLQESYNGKRVFDRMRKYPPEL